MTSFKHSGWSFSLLGLLSLVASACGTNSDSIGALGRGDSGTRTGGAVAGAEGQGGSGPGGAIASGGASGGSAAGGVPGAGGLASSGGAVFDAGLSGSGGKGGADANVDRVVSTDGGALEALCLATGGNVDSFSCCANQSDYPDSCLDGACSCASNYSRTVTGCICPAGSCFSRTTGCGPRGTGGAGGSGGKGGAGGSGGAVDGGKADAPDCTTTDLACPWGYVVDARGCQTCAPAPAGTGGAGGGDGGGSDIVISPDASGLAALCTSTGGHVNGSFCCSSVGDFPSSCLAEGLCSCSPAYSRTILTCTCPTGSCFSATAGCTPSTSPGVDAAPNSDGNGCTAQPSGDSLCGGTRPPHYYACILTMLPDPCVIQNLGSMTNGFCCP